MVISRSNVCYQRSQHIKRSTIAQPLLQLHVGGDLVHSHMSRTLYHYLYIAFPRTLGQSTQFHQFADLSRIGAVRIAARTQSITQTDGHVIFPQNVQHVVIVFVERVFVAGHLHPREQQRAAAGNNIGGTLLPLEGFHRTAVDAGVNGLEIHTLFGMCLQHFQKVRCLDVCQIFFQIANGIIHRHGADHCRRHFDQLFPESMCLSVVGQIHDRFALKLNCQLDLFELCRVIVAISGDAQIHVHFRPQSLADAVGVQALVVDICRNANGTLCHPLPDQFRLQMFFLGNSFHFRCQNALFCGIHLCCICSHVFYSFLLCNMIFL